jgi:hypothetical protein
MGNKEDAALLRLQAICTYCTVISAMPVLLPSKKMIRKKGNEEDKSLLKKGQMS